MKHWKSASAGVVLLSFALFGSTIDTAAVKLASPAPAVVSAPLRAPTPVPIGTIPVGQIVQLSFSDLTPAVARKSHIGYYPRPTGAVFFPAVGLNGDVAVFFSSPVAAKVLVWIDSPGAGGVVEHAEMEITIGTPGPVVPPVDPPIDPPDPPKPTQATLLLITGEGDWCEACSAVKADTLPTIQKSLGDRLTMVDYSDAKAAKAFSESVLVPRWVLTRPDGKVEKAIGYKTVAEIDAWIAKQPGAKK